MLKALLSSIVLGRGVPDNINLEFVLLGLKGHSVARPSVNFATLPMPANKFVSPPPSPPLLTRAPGGWDSQDEDQAASVSDTLVTSGDLMRLSQRLVDEVGNRTSQTIRTGMLQFYCLLMGLLLVLVVCSLSWSLLVCVGLWVPFFLYAFFC